MSNSRAQQRHILWTFGTVTDTSPEKGVQQIRTVIGNTTDGWNIGRLTMQPDGKIAASLQPVLHAHHPEAQFLPDRYYGNGDPVDVDPHVIIAALHEHTQKGNVLEVSCAQTALDLAKTAFGLL